MKTANSGTLNHYQVETKSKIENALSQNRSILCQIMVGAGASYILVSLLREKLSLLYKKVLIVSNSTFRLDDIENLLAQKNVDSVSPLDVSESMESYICLQTIRAINKTTHLPEFDLVVTLDVNDADYNDYIDYKSKFNPSTKHLFVSNSSVFKDERMSWLFHETIPAPGFKYFVDHGYLAPLKHYISSIQQHSDLTTGILSQTKKVSGTKVEEKEIVESFLKFSKHTPNGTSICFVSNVKSGKKLVKLFSDSNIDAIMLLGPSYSDETLSAISNFSKKQIKVLVVCSAKADSYNLPSSDIVQIGSNSGTHYNYLKMLQPAMRRSEKKKEGLVLDHAGLGLKYGLASHPDTWQRSTKSESNQLRDLLN